MPKICQNCGFQLDEAMNFCPNCRTRYIPPQVVAPSQAPVAPVTTSPVPVQPRVNPSAIVGQVSATMGEGGKIALTPAEENALFQTVFAYPLVDEDFCQVTYSNEQLTVKFSTPGDPKPFPTWVKAVLCGISLATAGVGLIVALPFWVFDDLLVFPLTKYTATIPVTHQNGVPQLQVDRMVLKKSFCGAWWIFLFVSIIFGWQIYWPILLFKKSKRSAVKGRESLDRRLAFGNFCLRYPSAFLTPSRPSYDFRGKAPAEIAAVALPSWKQGALPNMVVNRAPNINLTQFQQLGNVCNCCNIKPEDVIAQICIPSGKSGEETRLVFTTKEIYGVSEVSPVCDGLQMARAKKYLPWGPFGYNELTLRSYVNGVLLLESQRKTTPRASVGGAIIPIVITVLQWNTECNMEIVAMHKELIEFLHAMQQRNA